MFLTIRKHDCYTMFETKLLRVLHLFITIGEFLRHCFNSLSIRFPYQWKNVEQKADARDLKKVPTHLGLILCEEQISLPDIANAVVWSIALGVSYFSIYDINGYVKRRRKEFGEVLENAQKTSVDEERRRYSIVIHSDAESRPHENGCNSANQINVQLLSKADGHQSLVETTQFLCRQVASKQRHLEDITPTTVDEIINEISHFPDPELVLRFGEGECLFGFLPWQIRLTEILFAGSHHKLGYKALTDLYHKYGETKQRFGR
uniref:ditrans,polycis-polyprenyl diphosphate synthase [(2E,6E)-farnesyldiphosphate specific] n=1 Tax=Crassostrea virginica TaxID=6565 RepID=A0A8B8AM55_CRAVI|nr:dehydrodolichyl diphosphate synthase complex subunit nus1-like [Crassostrea virginica]